MNLKKQPVVAVLLGLMIAFAGNSVANAQSSNELRDRSGLEETIYSISLPDDEDDDEDDDESGDESDSCRPDPPCFDDDNRFADCGNGTVTDQVTGLIWLQETTCLGLGYYKYANELAASLGAGTVPACNLDDGSCPGDWRLATKEEWEVIMSQAQANGCAWPDIVFPDTEGLGCWAPGDVFHDVTHFFGYWTSTTDSAFPDNAWFANTASGSGGVFRIHKTGGCVDSPDDCDRFPPIHLLPVRGN